MRALALSVAPALACAALLAETPAGLLRLGEQTAVSTPQRDWKRLGIGTAEIRQLDRVLREETIEAWNIGYKSDELSISGFLARPTFETNEQGKPMEVFPAVILAHGSNGQGVTAPYREIALEFARRGYVAVASSYRGNGGPSGRSEGRREYAKGETLDVLQLVQLVRKLDYVDSQRMALWGQGEGGSIAAQVAGRSNVFQAAVIVAPDLFSGMSEYGFAGMRRLAALTQELSGRNPSDGELVRELRARDAFYPASRIRTPMLIVAPENDPAAAELGLWEGVLRQANVQHRTLRYAGMFSDFLTAADNGLRPSNWPESRENAWANTFAWIETYCPSGPAPPRR